MHDLNTITRLNFQAFEAGVTKARAAGKYVITHREGLHLVGFETFTNQQEALEALTAKSRAAGPGEDYALLNPLPQHHGATRDQSEDRAQPRTLEQLAALGAEKTLGDYIARKG